MAHPDRPAIDSVISMMLDAEIQQTPRGTTSVYGRDGKGAHVFLRVERVTRAVTTVEASVSPMGGCTLLVNPLIIRDLKGGIAVMGSTGDSFEIDAALKASVEHGRNKF